MASGIVGDMALGAIREVSAGRRPVLGDLFLTPANAARIADRLAEMRGAAMKVGQLLSMDGQELLSPEFARILGRLRSDAHFMPPGQLRTVLTANWGSGFLSRFRSFQTTPIAAASIGQVHRAVTRDGRDVAIKVQYPGVRRSIDSDVENIATLIRVSGLLPRGADIRPLLEEAKRQLHEEADYAREGRFLARFGALLADSSDFLVPALHDDLSTSYVLAMSFAEGVPIEDMAEAPQDLRDRIAGRLIDLVLRELFEFGLMQTDPNFANYRYDAASNRIVLLDFGAAREIPRDMAEAYRRLLRVGLADAPDDVLHAAEEVGFLPRDLTPEHRHALARMFQIAFAPLRHDADFDFAASDLVQRLRDAGMAIGDEEDLWHLPPSDTLFIQRKIGGTYLIASRLGARVNVHRLVTRHL
jgi:predicted unusual protein kinase regulating ubiquinone biosynthesis (AarF/ABC1/UbiB family)